MQKSILLTRMLTTRWTSGRSDWNELRSGQAPPNRGAMTPYPAQDAEAIRRGYEQYARPSVPGSRSGTWAAAKCGRRRRCSRQMAELPDQIRLVRDRIELSTFRY
jgi:hypothetical protein